MDTSHPRRWIVSRMASGVLLVAALCLLAGCAAPSGLEGLFGGVRKGGGPGPSPFVWREVTPAPATPQEAFEEGISDVRLCRTRPGRALATAWLTAGPTYGVVLLRSDCSNDPVDQHPALAILPFSLVKDTHPECPAWTLAGGMVESQRVLDENSGPHYFPNGYPDPRTYQIPSWLLLPPDTYEPEMRSDSLLPSALFLLKSSTRLFIAGRFAGSATRPAGAEMISVGGRAGWQATDGDVVTVTVPLADGWTFYFSGTADAATMRRLASGAMSHLETLLPKPAPPAQPSGGCY